MSYSQISQDVFVFNFFDKKQSGSFLDLGCGDGISLPCGNNTYLLELNGWSGLSVDVDSNLVNIFKTKRKTKVFECDLIKTSLFDVVKQNNCELVFDYLSFDVDDATDNVLSKFPFNELKFNFITFEHNLYHPRYRGLKERSQKLFLSNGYELLIENVSLAGIGPIEDWYVNPQHNFSKKIFLKDVSGPEILLKYGYN